MEFDRYQKHHKLYFFGIICLLLSLSFLAFSLYILPFLIWKLHYQVPELVFYLITFFEDTYEFSETKSAVLTGLIFFIPSVITGFISYYVSNSIDNEIYEIELPEESKLHSIEKQKDMKESFTIGFEIIGLMILVVVALSLVQWLI